MNWKDWSYWFKGGVISLIVLLVLGVLSFITPSGDMGNIYQWIIIFMALPLIPLFSSLAVYDVGVLAILMLSVYFFLLGSLIGWIVGKIASKLSK